MWLCSSSLWRTQRSLLVGCPPPAWRTAQLLSSSCFHGAPCLVSSGNTFSHRSHYRSERDDPSPSSGFLSQPITTNNYKPHHQPFSSQAVITKPAIPQPLSLSTSFSFPIKTLPTTPAPSPSRPQSGQSGYEIVASQKKIHDAIELLNLDAVSFGTFQKFAIATLERCQAEGDVPNAVKAVATVIRQVQAVSPKSSHYITSISQPSQARSGKKKKLAAVIGKKGAKKGGSKSVKAQQQANGTNHAQDKLVQDLSQMTLKLMAENEPESNLSQIVDKFRSSLLRLFSPTPSMPLEPRTLGSLAPSSYEIGPKFLGLLIAPMILSPVHHKKTFVAKEHYPAIRKVCNEIKELDPQFVFTPEEFEAILKCSEAENLPIEYITSFKEWIETHPLGKKSPPLSPTIEALYQSLTLAEAFATALASLPLIKQHIHHRGWGVETRLLQGSYRAYDKIGCEFGKQEIRNKAEELFMASPDNVQNFGLLLSTYSTMENRKKYLDLIAHLTVLSAESTFEDPPPSTYSPAPPSFDVSPKKPPPSSFDIPDFVLSKGTAKKLLGEFRGKEHLYEDEYARKMRQRLFEKGNRKELGKWLSHRRETGSESVADYVSYIGLLSREVRETGKLENEQFLQFLMKQIFPNQEVTFDLRILSAVHRHYIMAGNENLAVKLAEQARKVWERGMGSRKKMVHKAEWEGNKQKVRDLENQGVIADRCLGTIFRSTLALLMRNKSDKLMDAVRAYHEIVDQMDPTSLFPKFSQAGVSAHNEMMNVFMANREESELDGSTVEYLFAIEQALARDNVKALRNLQMNPPPRLLPTIRDNLPHLLLRTATKLLRKNPSHVKMCAQILSDLRKRSVYMHQTFHHELLQAILKRNRQLQDPLGASQILEILGTGECQDSKVYDKLTQYFLIHEDTLEAEICEHARFKAKAPRTPQTALQQMEIMIRKILRREYEAKLDIPFEKGFREVLGCLKEKEKVVRGKVEEIKTEIVIKRTRDWEENDDFSDADFYNDEEGEEEEEEKEEELLVPGDIQVSNAEVMEIVRLFVECHLHDSTVSRRSLRFVFRKKGGFLLQGKHLKKVVKAFFAQEKWGENFQPETYINFVGVVAEHSYSKRLRQDPLQVMDVILSIAKKHLDSEQLSDMEGKMIELVNSLRGKDAREFLEDEDLFDQEMKAFVGGNFLG